MIGKASAREREDLEGRLQMFRLVAAVLGLVIIVAGIVLAFFLFREIATAVGNPESFEARLDRWEKLVGGDSGLVVVLPQGTAPRAPTSGGARSDEVGINLARPLATFVLILLAWLLVRIAASMIGAGGKLVYLASPYRQLLKDVIRQRGTSGLSEPGP